jgi:hypothetical protein
MLSQGYKCESMKQALLGGLARGSTPPQAESINIVHLSIYLTDAAISLYTPSRNILALGLQSIGLQSVEAPGPTTAWGVVNTMYPATLSSRN